MNGVRSIVSSSKAGGGGAGMLCVFASDALCCCAPRCRVRTDLGRGTMRILHSSAAAAPTALGPD